LLELRVEKGPRDGMSCSKCAYWLPHVHYPMVGYCTLLNTITFEDYYCEGYSKVDVEVDRFYWCSTCRVRLTREEARHHWSLGHRISRGAYVDPDVREEIYEG